MKTLIVAATHAEIAPLLDHFKMEGNGLIRNLDFDVCITGVGIAATCFSLGRFLSDEYHQVLNLGIAGSFSQNIPLGALVSVTNDSFSELGAEDGDSFIPLNELGFGETNFEGMPIPDLQSVRGITVNTVHGNDRSIQRILAQTNPQVESMEGAAVFYCCKVSGIACWQVRAISNYVEKRNTAKWDVPMAVKALNVWAIDFLTTQK